MVTADLLFFFDQHPGALPLYETLEQQIFARIGPVSVKPQKTQIAFANRHNFAFVSFLPVRRAALRPKDYLTVTFGLGYKKDSARIDAATEPYPGRWTHHLMLTAKEEVDEELMGWLEEASAFAAAKR